MVFTGSDGWTTTSSGVSASLLTGANAFAISNDSFAYIAGAKA